MVDSDILHLPNQGQLWQHIYFHHLHRCMAQQQQNLIPSRNHHQLLTPLPLPR